MLARGQEASVRIRSLFNLRRDLVIAIAVPVAGKVMSVAAHQLRERRGPNQVADRLDQGAALIRRVSRLV
jgi:hypothetical protein